MRFRVKVDESATYRAKLKYAGRKKRAKQATHSTAAKTRATKLILTTRGTLRGGYFQWVKFPRRQLARGVYRITITMVAHTNGQRATTVKSKKFRVKPPKRRPR